MSEATANNSSGLLSKLKAYQDTKQYQELHWEGSFEDYLGLVQNDPKITRNAYQRIYDMIMSYGSEEYVDSKKKIIRYNFFDAKQFGGDDAIFGLDIPLMKLVHFFKSAALGYGTERRVLLLHGPVGTAKSTIARLLKRGLEEYSKRPDAALYTYEWRIPRPEEPELYPSGTEIMPCPMHEEPLNLLPKEIRMKYLEDIGVRTSEMRLPFELCPACRFVFNEMLDRHSGDLTKVLEHVHVKRLILSEQDRVGIGTFQPKDEKNQDSTELTGDINYRKIALYGSDSDPRAFNFDGEFNIANRGIIEFVEVLKLDVAFLYDLLSASQEHKIKPKKFAQTDIDEVIIGHSVAGETPIMVRHDNAIQWTTLEELHESFGEDATGLEVLAMDLRRGLPKWTPVHSVFRHKFSGSMLTTSQKWGVVETTPNHSIYNREGKVFYPEDRHEILAIRELEGFLDPVECAKPFDLTEGMEGLLSSESKAFSDGAPITKPCQPGWARLDLPRHATAIQALYDPAADEEALKDLISVLVWYATEGHVNGRNGGIVITQANKAELERIQAAYGRITTASGSIDAGAKTDSAWRLYLGANLIAEIAKHHCGELSENKRLPNFLFQLPPRYLQHALDELIRTDGSRATSAQIDQVSSDEYKENYFEYKTVSSMLAAQVGTLATLLGYDYSVYDSETTSGKRAYRIRYVSGSGKRGGRHNSFQARLHQRQADDEWVYDIECVGLHNFICGVGNVCCHNTNEAEYKKLLNNEFMEALRDRTVKIDIPYITRIAEEVRIYERDFNAEKIKGKHIAPHTLRMAAMWAILTRLEEPKKANLTLLQKLKLYDGKSLPGYTEDNIKELRKETVREGMEGMSPRYIQDKISNALVSEQSGTSINPFLVLNELGKGLKNHSLVTNEDDKQRYIELLDLVKQEYEDIVKNEVQRAISADEEAINKLCANYIDNVKAHTQRERVKNQYTGQYEEPDERLMRSIEEKIDIPPSRKDDFRREIMNYIGALAVDGKTFDYRTNERLHKALELKLFEDQKDSIRLTSLVSNVIDKDTQEKIDVVKARLIRDYGYNDESANDVLSFVASIFARGDVKETS